MVRLIFLIMSLFFAAAGYAQTPLLSNWRSQILTVSESPISIDSLTVLPSSLRIIEVNTGQPIDTSLYQLKNNQIYWSKSLLQASPPQTLQLQYKVLPYNLSARFSHLDTSRILVDDDGSYIGFDYSPYDPQEGLIAFKGLDYNGSFARGLSFGNSQNLVLNSSFNLQLAGDLGDDIEILAAITDQNIPLQPEGNTQQLQEFDKIFIQLKKKNNVFIAGDYELARPESYFMNYYKKLQGATYQNDNLLSNSNRLSVKASGAVARGKFARNTLTPIEGNQGPYKLQGREGEPFIIVLAGTEKVYIDGQLLVRGIEEDYIIDYNRAELTFTPKRLITKDRRIIVEFEYNTQNFLRSMFAAGTEYQSKKARVYFQLYSEQDGRNSGAAQELDSLDRIALGNAGDDLMNTFGPGIDSLEELSEFRVKYRLVDTSYTVIGQGNIRDTVLVFSTDSENARYTATFVRTEFGFGDYILDTQNGANGRVYRWVAPDSTGQRQGSYFPGRRLIAPSQQQMFAVGGEYQLSKNASIQTEVALSNTDLNRFSSLDDQDNLGLAVFSHYQQKNKLGMQAKSWELQTDVRYEHVRRNFRSLNPYRDAEFNRDWNLRNQQAGSTDENEQLIKAGMRLSKDSLGSIAYDFGGFYRGGLYTGNKHFAKLYFERGGFRAELEGSILLSKDSTLDGRFFRPKIDLSKQFSRLDNWTAGIYGERERNEQRLLSGDSLSPLSFYYDLFKAYLNSPQSEDRPAGVEVSYLQRYDYAPLLNDFKQNTKADELAISGYWNSKKDSRLKWIFTYRQLEIKDPLLTNETPQQTFLGRLEHSLSLLKGAIRSNTTYQIGSGQEPRIEYEYLKVNPGEGIYTWLEDRNGDGQVQLDEIEIAAFQDQADVVRITLFTNDFIRTNNVQLNQSLRIDTRKMWHQKKDLRKFLSRFSTQSTLQILRKTMEAGDISPWNPFQLNIADTSLVSVSSTIRNTLFFNRGNPAYDLQAGQFDNRSRNVLTTGFESRRSNEQFFRSRWNITKSLSSKVYVATGQQQNDSEFFNTRDYDIRVFKLEPSLSFQIKQNFRTIFSYKFLDSENRLEEGGETSRQHDFNIEATFSKSAATSFRLSGSFVKVNFAGEAGTPVEFAMLQGLQDGANYLWTLGLNRRLAKNIQMNISYEGRKTGISKVVHVGRAQVRATF